MTKYLFSFGADGSVSGLLKDKVLDTRIFGDRSVKRITLIEHDEDTQKFFIKWLRGPYAGIIHDGRVDAEILDNSEGSAWSDDEYALFDDYEQAVAHEIKCVNALRERGAKFD